MAAKLYRSDIVSLLLEAGADIEALDKARYLQPN
jgi:hypothetical protein